MLTHASNLKFYICFIIVLIHNITVPTFSSFDLSMFTEEDGTTINNEDKENLIKKKLKLA